MEVHKYEIINAIIAKYNLKSYLEIGLDNADNYKMIKCKKKESVDPYMDKNENLIDINKEASKYLTYRMTSDEFFEKEAKNKKYDFIFIDGYHYDKQVVKDIYNAMQHLSDKGFIMMHDCLPLAEIHQVVPALPSHEHDAWTGNVWKTLPTIDKTMQHIKYETINTDWGLGFLPKQELNFNPEDYNSDLTWEDYSTNRDKLMHIVSVEDFVDKYDI